MESLMAHIKNEKAIFIPENRKTASTEPIFQSFDKEQ